MKPHNTQLGLTIITQLMEFAWTS